LPSLTVNYVDRTITFDNLIHNANCELAGHSENASQQFKIVAEFHEPRVCVGTGETADEIFRAPKWKEASSTFRSGK